MITQFCKRRIVSESMLRQTVQWLLMLIGAIVLVTGFRKVAELELTEAQMFLGFGIVISLVLQCFTLWVLIDLKRKGI